MGFKLYQAEIIMETTRPLKLFFWQCITNIILNVLWEHAVNAWYITFRVMYLVCLWQNALLLFCLLAKSFYLRNCIEFLHCHMYTNYYKKNKNKIWLDREERWYKNNKTKGEINIFLLFSLLLIRIELHNVYLFIHDFTNFARYVMSENTAVVH